MIRPKLRPKLRPMPGSKYNTDPASAASTGNPIIRQSVFDTDRLMRALKQGLIQGIPELPYPSDELLISTMVSLGMPRWAADQMRHNPNLRLAFYGTWVSVGEAAKGDAEAKEMVDVIRAYYQEARRDELVADRPDMSVGIWER